ncbi:hypothetical protein VPH35_006123 [Triticum aestivum]
MISHLFQPINSFCFGSFFTLPMMHSAGLQIPAAWPICGACMDEYHPCMHCAAYACILEGIDRLKFSFPFFFHLPLWRQGCEERTPEHSATKVDALPFSSTNGEG